MVLLKSIEIPLGKKAPSFSLKDTDGKTCSLDKVMGKKGLIIIFTCNHCPYAQAVWERVIRIAHQAKDLGINTIAINPNIHPGYPDDSVHGMKKLISTLEIKFPYLLDDTQETAKAYHAQCTPDIYLLDKDSNLVYHGRIDDNWQDENKVTRHELLQAVTNLAKNLPPIPQSEQKPSMGCSIKWK